MSSEKLASASGDPNPSTHANEPQGSPLKLLAVIAIVLIVVLVFGALDS